MQKGTNFVLKATILLIGIAVLGLCTIVLPLGIQTTHVGGYRPILIGMYIPAVPFFYGLYQAWSILDLVARKQVFTAKCVQSLSKIKYSALIISALYAAGMPYIYKISDLDDAPGVVLIGLIIVGASFVVSAAAALFQQVMQSAVELKSENELTI